MLCPRAKNNRIIVSLISIFVLLLFLVSSNKAVAFGKPVGNAGQRTREINIVYDDSGSMYNVTSWSQAKYALEVFTAMMNENDTINIYELSQDGKKPVTLEGKNDAQNNVNVVDALYGYGGTPFDPVRVAGNALMQSEADEKWMIIITDGEFGGSNDPASEILSFVGQNNTKVVYIAIGSEDYVMDMTPYAKEMFYPYHTDENNILDTMTSAATLVFNYKPLPLHIESDGTTVFDADVPLEKLIIFAQGENANVSNVKVNGAEINNGADTTVKVKVDAKSGGALYGPLARGLNGIVFSTETLDPDHPFADGKYTFNCNVGNVQVFVEPGVSVEATLRGETGEAINIEDKNLKEIPEGDWTVDVQLINPLNGQPVSLTESSILAGASLDVVITDDQGNTREYNNGDTVNISGKKIELYGRASFQGMNGTIEKTSQLHSLEVVKSKLYLSFSNPGGYNLDAVLLQPDHDITFAISINGKQLSSEQADKVKFQIDNTEGISWDIEKVDNEGTYRLVPSYAKRKGLDAVTGGDTELTVSASLRDSGDKREGEATAKLHIDTETQAGLQLTLTMPPESITNKKGDRSYMFDCQVRGLPTGEPGDQERPYILVEVQAMNPDGSARPLTDEEWEQGANNFSYNAAEHYPNFLWRLAQICVGWQTLEFKAVKGDMPSTYKLYLDGLLAKRVLPNTSELNVTMTYQYDNGAKLVGTADGVVSVKPLPLWQYLIWLLAIITVLLLIVALVIREATKPHFSKDFRPWVTVNGKRYGTAPKLVTNSYAPLIRKRHRWSLTKSEQCTITDNDPNGIGMAVTFAVTATDKDGHFKLNQLMVFNRFATSGAKFFTTEGCLNYQQMAQGNKWQRVTFDEYNGEIALTKRQQSSAYTKRITFSGNPI